MEQPVMDDVADSACEKAVVLLVDDEVNIVAALKRLLPGRAMDRLLDSASDQ